MPLFPEGLDFRHGRWQDVFDDETQVDTMIVDPEYSERVHTGHDSLNKIRAPLGYGPMTARTAREYVKTWAPRVRGWFCVMTSHDLGPIWEHALKKAGRYVFAPLPVIDVGSRTRMHGDGPASWTVWMIVARPKTLEFSLWGSLPGKYEREKGDRRSRCKGGKPLGVMRAIVRDYSRPGDLVGDTHAGFGTTLKAALFEGRRAIGSECNDKNYEAAVNELALAPTLPDKHGVLPLFG